MFDSTTSAHDQSMDRDAAPTAFAPDALRVAVLSVGAARTFVHTAVHNSQLTHLLNPLRRAHAKVDFIAVFDHADANRSDVLAVLKRFKNVRAEFIGAPGVGWQGQWLKMERAWEIMRQAPIVYDWVIRTRPDHYWSQPLPLLATLAGDSIHLQLRCLGSLAGSTFTEGIVENSFYQQLQQLCGHTSVHKRRDDGHTSGDNQTNGSTCACGLAGGLTSCASDEFRVSDQLAVLPPAWQEVYMSGWTTLQACGDCPCCCLTAHLTRWRARMHPLRAHVTIAREHPKNAKLFGLYPLGASGLFVDAPTVDGATNFSWRAHRFRCESRG